MIRGGLKQAWAARERQQFLHAAAKVQGLQKELVQKTVHQLGHYNSDTLGAFVNPVITMASFKKDWEKKVEGLSEEEVADLQQARD